MNLSISIKNYSVLEAEKLLVKGCLEGELACQEELYKQHYGKTMTMVKRYILNSEDALEVLNTGFLKVYQNLEFFKFNSKLSTWIYSIVQRTAIDFLRKANNLEYVKLESVENYAVANESVLESLYEKDILSYLNKLPPASRVVFNLYAIDGFTHKDIAKQLNISEGTSKWHLNNARTILKIQLTHLL